MTTQEVLTAISTVGFPIVACCGMYYFTVVVVSRLTKAIEKLTEKLE